MVAAILAVLLASGCISSPEKGTSNSSIPTTVSTVRFVQINLLDGTIVGGKYVSETPAFTTINVMYTMDPNAHTWDADKNYVIDLNKSFVKGNGAEVSIKNSLINTMVTIDNPTQMIEAKLQEINATMDARKKVAEEKAESIRIEKAKYEAEIAKRMPTKKSNH
jgi:hypothetical protein